MSSLSHLFIAFLFVVVAILAFIVLSQKEEIIEIEKRMDTLEEMMKQFMMSRQQQQQQQQQKEHVLQPSVSPPHPPRERPSHLLLIHFDRDNIPTRMKITDFERKMKEYFSKNHSVDIKIVGFTSGINTLSLEYKNLSMLFLRYEPNLSFGASRNLRIFMKAIENDTNGKINKENCLFVLMRRSRNEMLETTTSDSMNISEIIWTEEKGYDMERISNLQFEIERYYLKHH